MYEKWGNEAVSKINGGDRLSVSLEKSESNKSPVKELFLEIDDPNHEHDDEAHSFVHSAHYNIKRLGAHW